MNKLKNIVIFCLISFIITGCVDCNILIDCNNKQSIRIDLYIQDDLLTKYDTKIDDLEKMVVDNFKDWKIVRDSKVMKAKRYSGFILEAPTSFINDYLKFSSKDGIYSLLMDFDLDTSELNHYIDTLKLLNYSGCNCLLKVYMPGTIVESNYGTYHNNVVTINLLQLFINQDKLSFKVIAKKNNQQLILYLYTLIIIMIVLYWLYLIKKKEKDI